MVFIRRRWVWTFNSIPNLRGKGVLIPNFQPVLSSEVSLYKLHCPCKYLCTFSKSSFKLLICIFVDPTFKKKNQAERENKFQAIFSRQIILKSGKYFISIKVASNDGLSSLAQFSPSWFYKICNILIKHKKCVLYNFYTEFQKQLVRSVAI